MSLKRVYVDYYRQNRISPVSQDISDLDKHYKRRDGLYRHLGLGAKFLDGKTVLEFGPGGGYNPIHTLSKKPSLYVLVDGNETGLENARELLNKHEISSTSLEYHLSLIQHYKDERLFDVVLCEGLLSFQEEPRQILAKVASFVGYNGVLVVTSQDEVSSISDFIRIAIGRALRSPSLPLDDQAEQLVPVFGSSVFFGDERVRESNCR